MAGDSGVWRAGGGDGEAVFTRAELERALKPHLEAEHAHEEAGMIVATLRDSAITGAVLSDEVLAMLAVTSAELAERVAAYRAETVGRRREAWLRRERRSVLVRGASSGGRGSGLSTSLESELEGRWEAEAEAEEREWKSLLERVRLAVEQQAVRQAGGEGGLIRVQDGRRP